MDLPPELAPDHVFVEGHESPGLLEAGMICDPTSWRVKSLIQKRGWREWRFAPHVDYGCWLAEYGNGSEDLVSIYSGATEGTGN